MLYPPHRCAAGVFYLTNCKNKTNNVIQQKYIVKIGKCFVVVENKVLKTRGRYLVTKVSFEDKVLKGKR